ncbi:putative polysaccharide biosynthesis protein [Thalassobacillus hwangdonensis]
MNDSTSSKQLFQGALILTIAGLLSKVLSAGYRVPLQNITGDLGFYIYQQVYPLLGIIMVLSLYGFPVAVSKIVAEYNNDSRDLCWRTFYIPVVSVLLVVCVVLFLLVYIGAGSIAGWMGDEAIEVGIQSAAVAFLLVPFTSLLRGVFQGMNDMRPTAVSQIIEQLVRVAIIIAVAFIAVDRQDMYLIGPGAAFGAVFGGLAAFAYLALLFHKRKPWNDQTVEAALSIAQYIKTVFVYGLFICLNYMLLLLLQLADAFTLVPGLVDHGLELEEAKVTKGIFDRGHPLIQLGTVLGSSLALALIPTITKNRMMTKPDAFRFHIRTAIKLSLGISIGATVGLILLFPYVNELLFQDQAGTNALRILMLVILFSSLAITASSILQGMDYIFHTALFVLVGVGIKWTGNWLLIPYAGIHGAALASVISVGVVLVLNRWLIRKRVVKGILPWQLFLKVGLALTGMGLFVLSAIFVEQTWLDIATRVQLAAYTLMVSGLGGLIYLILLIKLRCFGKKELEQFPYGEYLITLLPRRTKP